MIAAELESAGLIRLRRILIVLCDCSIIRVIAMSLAKSTEFSDIGSRLNRLQVFCPSAGSHEDNFRDTFRLRVGGNELRDKLSKSFQLQIG